mmetsp:Transcript_23701/g.45096  ORF Transcript_23701/g.45096 Transcript_23701/m.45096 type:complete len:253 (+) Transcript_23701:1255-2013(+)
MLHHLVRQHVTQHHHLVRLQVQSALHERVHGGAHHVHGRLVPTELPSCGGYDIGNKVEEALRLARGLGVGVVLSSGLHFGRETVGSDAEGDHRAPACVLQPPHSMKPTLRRHCHHSRYHHFIIVRLRSLRWCKVHVVLRSAYVPTLHLVCAGFLIRSTCRRAGCGRTLVFLHVRVRHWIKVFVPHALRRICHARRLTIIHYKTPSQLGPGEHLVVPVVVLHPVDSGDARVGSFAYAHDFALNPFTVSPATHN